MESERQIEHTPATEGDRERDSMTEGDDTDLGYGRQRLRPFQNLRDHIVIVKWLGVLIILCVCMTVVGIVGILTAETSCATGPDCDQMRPRVYINFMHDNAIDGTHYLNLTTCIFIHRWRSVAYGSNYTVCQTDAGPAILDVYLNGSLSYFIDVEQWTVLKYMMPEIDASIEKASSYLANYVPDTSGK
jgi:hypothetical protein